MTPDLDLLPHQAPSDGYCRAAWQAVCRFQAVIEFDLSGIITWANERFMLLMGYDLSALNDHHHRKLCDPVYAASAEYAQFWETFRAGEFEQGKFSRLRADGSEIWMQAGYNPIFNADGVIQRVLKIASDVSR